MSNTKTNCVFCELIQQESSVAKIFEDELVFVFLDKRPLFHGHSLLIPKQHHPTLTDLPLDILEPFFHRLQQLAQVVKCGMKAEGTFIAMNNQISQSVPHLHVHVVPRRKGDGLKGFFWPRTTYTPNELAKTQAVLIATWKELCGE